MAVELVAGTIEGGGFGPARVWTGLVTPDPGGRWFAPDGARVSVVGICGADPADPCDSSASAAMLEGRGYRFADTDTAPDRHTLSLWSSVGVLAGPILGIDRPTMPEEEQDQKASEYWRDTYPYTLREYLSDSRAAHRHARGLLGGADRVEIRIRPGEDPEYCRLAESLDGLETAAVDLFLFKRDVEAAKRGLTATARGRLPYWARSGYVSSGGRQIRLGKVLHHVRPETRKAAERLRDAGRRLEYDAEYTVSITCRPHAFLRLSKYGVDPGSCYKDGGLHEFSPYIIGVQHDSVVYTITRADSRSCLARAWGFVEEDGAIVTNFYGDGMKDNGTGARMIALALGAVLGVDPDDRVKHSICADYVYLNGDMFAIGDVYTDCIDEGDIETLCTCEHCGARVRDDDTVSYGNPHEPSGYICHDCANNDFVQTYDDELWPRDECTQTEDGWARDDDDALRYTIGGTPVIVEN